MSVPNSICFKGRHLIVLYSSWDKNKHAVITLKYLVFAAIISSSSGIPKSRLALPSDHSRKFADITLRLLIADWAHWKRYFFQNLVEMRAMKRYIYIYIFFYLCSVWALLRLAKRKQKILSRILISIFWCITLSVRMPLNLLTSQWVVPWKKSITRNSIRTQKQ